jgi:DNA-directed RNA polymerase alpha subunit
MLARSNIPVWIVRALLSNGVKRVSKLAAMTDDELLAIPGIGRRAVEVIRSAVGAFDSGRSKR